MYLIAQKDVFSNDGTFLFMHFYTNLPFNQEQIFVLILDFSYETMFLKNEWRDDPLLTLILLIPHSVTDVDE